MWYFRLLLAEWQSRSFLGREQRQAWDMHYYIFVRKSSYTRQLHDGDDGKTYTVRAFRSEARFPVPNTVVTVPAALTSVRVTIECEPLVAYSVLILVVVYVRLLSVLTTTCTVPMVVGVIYWLQV